MTERLRQFTLTRPLLRKVLGVFFLIAGFVALVTPFTPGAILMLFLGFEFLGLRFLFLTQLKQRFSKE